MFVARRAKKDAGCLGDRAASTIEMKQGTKTATAEQGASLPKFRFPCAFVFSHESPPIQSCATSLGGEQLGVVFSIFRLGRALPMSAKTSISKLSCVDGTEDM